LFQVILTIFRKQARFLARHGPHDQSPNETSGRSIRRFASQEHRNAGTFQPRCQQTRLGGFSRPVYALEDEEERSVSEYGYETVVNSIHWACPFPANAL
jgi:hypothetical protein